MSEIRQSATKSFAWWIGVALIPFFAAVIYIADGFTAAARMFPFYSGIVGLVLVVAHTAIGLTGGVAVDDEDMFTREERSEYLVPLIQFGLIGLAVGLFVWLVGFHISLPVFLLLFIGLRTRRWLAASISALTIWVFTFVILQNSLHIILPSSLLQRWLVSHPLF